MCAFLIPVSNFNTITAKIACCNLLLFQIDYAMPNPVSSVFVTDGRCSISLTAFIPGNRLVHRTICIKHIAPTVPLLKQNQTFGQP